MRQELTAPVTAVMGYAAVLWFERGERLTSETLKQITRSVTSYLIDSLRGLGKNKPSKQGLQERIAAALEQAPLAQGGLAAEAGLKDDEGRMTKDEGG